MFLWLRLPAKISRCLSWSKTNLIMVLQPRNFCTYCHLMKCAKKIWMIVTRHSALWEDDPSFGQRVIYGKILFIWLTFMSISQMYNSQDKMKIFIKRMDCAKYFWVKNSGGVEILEGKYQYQCKKQRYFIQKGLITCSIAVLWTYLYQKRGLFALLWTFFKRTASLTWFIFLIFCLTLRTLGTL